MTPLISLKSDTLRYTGVCISNPHHAAVPRGVTAVVGRNGCGKTSLATIMARGANYMTNHIEYATPGKPNIKIVAFTDIYSLTGFAVEYYQQRFESMMNDDVPTVARMLGDKVRSPEWEALTTLMGLGDVAERKPNFLSSGELRKLLIANALTETPNLLVLDNPYIGLDAGSRHVVDDALCRLGADGVSVMLLVADPDDIPPYADTVIPMRRMLVDAPMHTAGTDMEILRRRIAREYFADEEQPLPFDTGATVRQQAGEPVVDMVHCRVRLGDREVLRDVNWTVRSGEAWALSGPNGSGKSTLLSLVNADNPQAYCNDVSLFGRRRGTGESIWEIKERIGYMSSEMHLYFRHGGDTVQGVLHASLRTAIGRYAAVSDGQKAAVERWLAYFGIADLAQERYATLSFGQQRLVLLVSALLRNAPLLILDEPMHGLDRCVKAKALRAIEALNAQGATLIYVTHTLSEMPRCITHSKVLEKTL